LVQWILCVSGDRQIAVELREQLRRMRFRAETAGGITEALEIIKKRLPTLMVVDFHLVDGSGLELLRQVCRDERAARIPVLMLATPMQSEHYRHRSIRPAPQEWVDKPVDDERLAHAVSRWVGVEVKSRLLPEEPKFDHLTRLPDDGSFSEVPFARVLVLAGRRGCGRLRIERPGQWMEIWMEKTCIGAISSSYLPGNSLGELLVKNDVLSRYAVREGMSRLQPGQRLGRWLVENGLLTEDELNGELQKHVLDKLSVAFSWRWYEGLWSYIPNDQANGAQLRCEVDLRNLIFEGIGRYYDRDRLEMIFSKRERLRRALIPMTPHIDDLPVAARRLLKSADGRSSSVTVRERSGMEVRRFYQTLYALWVLDLARFGDPVKGEDPRRLRDEEIFLDHDETIGHRR